jgi:hypothetical protein
MGEAARATPAESHTMSAANAKKIVAVCLMPASFLVCPAPLPS